MTPLGGFIPISSQYSGWVRGSSTDSCIMTKTNVFFINSEHSPQKICGVLQDCINKSKKDKKNTSDCKADLEKHASWLPAILRQATILSKQVFVLLLFTRQVETVKVPLLQPKHMMNLELSSSWLSNTGGILQGADFP